VSEKCPCKVFRIGFNDIFLESGDDEELFSRYGMNTENIIQKALEITNQI
jgi:transketolase